MNFANRAAWVCAGLLALGVGGVWQGVGDQRRPNDQDLLENRLWAERVPRSERDMVVHVALLNLGEEGRVGAGLVASQHRVLLDRFVYQRDGDQLDVHFLQDNRKGRLTARARRCEDRKADGFELCLDLRQGRDVLRLYSRDDWELDPDAMRSGGTLPNGVALPGFGPLPSAFEDEAAEARAPAAPLEDLSALRRVLGAP
jgi:hypothetical protein